MIFQIGETVIFSIAVRDTDGALQDAATSTKITIDQIAPQFSNLVSSTSMTKDSPLLMAFSA